MNDFLQSLRGGQKDKRSPKTRRGFDNSHNSNSTQGFNSHVPYQGARAGNNMKRPVTRASAHSHAPMESQPPFSSTELAETINLFIDAFSKSQKDILNVQERRVIAEERKAVALEEIAEYLRVVTTSPLQDASDGYENEIFDDNSFDERDSDINAASSKYQTPQTGAKLKPYREDDTDEIELTVEMDVDETTDTFDLRPPIETEKPVRRSFRGKKKFNADQHQKTNVEEMPFENSVEGNKALRSDAADNPVSKPFKKALTDSGKEEVKVITRKKAEKRGNEKKHEHREGILSRDEVMKIVYDMRANGKTFDEVAQHLTALGQPTFSGRGEWHAQTVHRLCNKRKK